MLRKTFILAAMLCISAATSWGQIGQIGQIGQMGQGQMTDEEVAEYVQREHQNGASQQTIVRNLLAKGVTTDQLTRVRRKYLAKANENKNLAEEHQNQMRPVREPYTPVNDVALYNDSLSFYMNTSAPESAIFGHDIFNKKNLTFEPNMNMPTPANYTLGAGDQVIIDIWGASQKTITQTISPEGVIVVNEIGPIHLAGLSIQAATATLKQKIGAYYGGSKISVALGNTRTIQVQVVGEVVMPGTYSLSGLATAFNALYVSGGINDIGTLRNIKVYRNNKVLAIVDVYDYLINGNSSSDVRLQDKDIIVVEPYECIVSIHGKVKRPMMYEMRPTESVKQLIRFSGGFTGDAYTKNVKLSRNAGEERSIHTIDEFEMGGFNIMDGDIVSVDATPIKYNNVVEVRGAVNHAGQFQLGNKIQSVKELLEAADGLREDAYIERAIMHRQLPDLSLEMVSVDLKGIMEGTAADVPLQKNDMLFIPSKTEMRKGWALYVKGEVIYPGKYPYTENTTLQDIILQAGGLTDAASLAHVDVYRRIISPYATEDAEQMAEKFSFSLNESFNIARDTTFYLKPFDEVYIRRSPGYEAQQNVSVVGCVNFPGQYTLTKKDFRLSDLVKAAGGLTDLAYPKAARLRRQPTKEEQQQHEKVLRKEHTRFYEEMTMSENGITPGQADTLLSMKMSLDRSQTVSIDLEKALANPGSEFDIPLNENDKLMIPKYNNTVKITGEVTYPLSMNYKKGEKLKYYINHAGGYAPRAKKKAVYAVYANGSVEKLNRKSRKAVQPGCEVVVPIKDEKGHKLTSAEKIAIGTGSASLASIIIALTNLISK